jgi:hypothetical protein
MRKLTFGMNSSLVGYIAAPGDDLGWSVPNDELFQWWSDRRLQEDDPRNRCPRLPVPPRPRRTRPNRGVISGPVGHSSRNSRPDVACLCDQAA